MDTTETITHLSLCSGYDGIGLGLRRIWSSVREIAHVEIEAFAAANLVAKMEAGELDAAPVWTDIKTFPAWAFRGCVDILSAGFPCQPFSAAGKGGADDDPRHLWPHVRQAIGLIRPGMVVLENVEGIVSSKLKGNDWHDPEGTPVLLHVLRELERTGYRCTWGVFSASEVGATHQRKRVFIIGVDDTGLFRPEIFQKYTTGIKQSGEELGNTKHDGSHATPIPRGTTETVRRTQKRENCSSEFEGANRPEELAHASEPGSQGHSGDESDWYQFGWDTAKSSGPVSEGGVWRKVSFAADCIGGDENEPGDICSICEGNYCDCDCPGPTQDGYEYREVDGVLYGREQSEEEPESQWPARPGEEQYEWEEPRVVGHATSKRLEGSGGSSLQRDDERPPCPNGITGQTEPKLGGAINGTSSRVDRLRLLGNGVVPQTAERAVKVLLHQLLTQQ